MIYPISVYLIRDLRDKNGALIEIDDVVQTESVPSYLLGRHLHSKDGDILFLYETIDMNGIVTWCTEENIQYNISDIHERFREVKR